ncbi:MAG: ABC transporter ATP-binding protein, partial [Caldilineaceae bacterium]|nr:ABC transporter ATP-binding protein [Caldilineaceae bacterium]
MSIPLRAYGSLLARYLQAHWHKVLLLIFFLFGAIALQLLNPQLVRAFIDAAQAGQPAAALLQLALLFLGAAVLKYLLTLALTYWSEDVGWRATNALRADLTAHCLRLDLPFHHRYTPGMLIERIDGDVGQLSHFFSRLLLQFGGNFLLLLGILSVLTWEDWRLGVGFLLFLLGALIILAWLRDWATPALEAERAASADLFGFLEERLGGTEDLRANGAVAYTVYQFFGYMRTLWQRGQRARIRSALFGSLIVVWLELGTVVALALGSILFLRDAVSIGTIYLLYAYLRMLTGPLLSMTGEIQLLQEASASIARIQALFAEQSVLPEGSQSELPN